LIPQLHALLLQVLEVWAVVAEGTLAMFLLVVLVNRICMGNCCQCYKHFSLTLMLLKK
jgi:hypothetical protein